MSQISEEQRSEILDRYFVAKRVGNKEEARRILREIPVPAWLAEAGKNIIGADFIKNSGYDLSDAEAVYGKDWLDR